MIICGPKLSLCGLILSVWGIVQLVVMGGLYYTKAVALLEDLPIEEHYGSITDFYAAVDAGYQQNALNCWIAACLYLITMLFSGYQFYLNSRSSVSM